MAININNLNNNQVKPSIDQQVKKNDQATQQTRVAEQTRPMHRDSVSITPQAQQMSELQKKSGDGPTIDQKKIEQLKKAIASGEYKVNAEKLAKSLMAFEFDLDRG